MIDKLGQTITPGSFIAYAHNLSGGPGLRIGKVLGIKTARRYPHGDISQIVVRGIDDDYKHKPIELTSRKGYILFPERVVVLDPKTIPVDYIALLESVPLED